jgi:hypothetical protein
VSKGKWAQGIRPRNFAWVIQERLAVCERPGGYGHNHRRVRRQEEIIWIREQGFTHVISLIPSPHNLHNYDELHLPWLHRPFGPHDDVHEVLGKLYPEIRDLLGGGEKLLVHQEELGDRLAGLMAGYLLWSGLVPQGPQAISIMEQIVQRQLGSVGRQLVTVAADLQAA